MYKLIRQVANVTRSQIDISSCAMYRIQNPDDPQGYALRIADQAWDDWLQGEIRYHIRKNRGTIGDPELGYDEFVEGNLPEAKRTYEAKEKPERTGNGRAWHDRAKTGAMVVSSYHNVQCIMHHNPGERVVTTATAPRLSVDARKIMPGTQKGNRYFLAADPRVFISGVVRWPRYVEECVPVWPTDVGWDLTPERMARDFAGVPIVPDNGLVTATIADANRGSIDLLTAAAELPETIKSVFGGISTIADFTKAAKKKEFELSKGHKQRKDKILKRYQEKLNKINSQRLGASNYKKKILERQAKELARNYSEALKKESLAFVDGVASVWMTYRYNIMPNVYLIDDALDTLGAWHSDYVTSRDKMEKSLLLTVPTDFVGETEAPLHHSCMLKRRYELSGDLSTRLLQVGSANIAVTALELARLSFVLGWFINLGDVLSAYTAVPVHNAQVCTYAIKGNFTSTFTGPNGCKVNVVLNGYKRDVIQPNDHIGLVFDPNITLYRAFDSIALLWPTVKSNIINLKRKKT